MKLRAVTVLFVFSCLAASGLLLSVTQGAAKIPADQIFWSLLHHTNGTVDQIIWNIRLPRAITGALVGVDLALSGAILQAIMRNPLADPHLIGVSSGAGAAGIVIIILYPAMTALLTPVAFCGAMTAAVVVYILAWRHGIQPLRMILAGVAVSALFGAVIAGLLIFFSDRVHGALVWMVGGLAAVGWNDVLIVTPYTAAGLVLALLGARCLNVLQLGDDMAKAVGLSVESVRLYLTAVAALLAAAAVSVAGLLGFVGLIVPHMARLLIGNDYRLLLPAAAVLGAAVVTLSDTAARVIVAPVELPVGIIMACLGAPFFLFLLRREL